MAVLASALEMSQNSERLSWTFEEVDGKLKGIMETIYANISDAAKRYNATTGKMTMWQVLILPDLRR